MNSVLAQLDSLIQEVRSLQRHRGALVVIDMQNDFLDSKGSMGLRGADLSLVQACVHSIQQLCQSAREQQVLIIWILAAYSGKPLISVPFCRPPGSHYGSVPLDVRLFGTHVGKTAICVPGTWGARLHPSFEICPEDLVVEKRYFSAFSGTSLEELLRARGITHLVLCGVTTANCVRATATDAFFRGFDVTIPKTTTASWNTKQHLAAWEALSSFASTPESAVSVFSSSSTLPLHTPEAPLSSISFAALQSPSTMALAELDVAIVGAGIGGLAVALSLQSENHSLRVGVFERDVSFDSRAQGYSLTIQGGFKALQSLGISEAVYKESTKGGSGQVLMRSDGECLMAVGGGRDSRNVFIPRQRLRKLMLDRLQAHTVRWDKALTGLREEENGVSLRFHDCSLVKAQIVIGADGVNSIVRQAKLKDPLHYLGVLALNGIADFRHPLCPNGNLQVLGNGSRLFAKPFSNGRTMWQLTLLCERARAEELARQGDVLGLALRLTASWHPAFTSLLQSSDLSQLRMGLLFDRDPNLCASHLKNFARVAVLGDAAHPMSPFKGQGANQALLDSMILGTSILPLFDMGLRQGGGASSSVTAKYEAVSRDTIYGVLVEFHRNMAARVMKAVLGSRNNVAFYHSTPSLTDVEAKFGVDQWTDRRKASLASARAKMGKVLALCRFGER